MTSKQEALDHIFQSFIAAKPYIAGKFDREVRDPRRLLALAEKLGLCPPADNVIKVTGSKGKGTTARLIAHGLQDEHRDQKIGLLISPEEFDHLDRMRINGRAIDEATFVHCYEFLKPHLPAIAPPEYLSPYGLFLLIALKWFQDEGVDHFVIECGRGVRFDEGGQLPAHLGIVTSVFKEHAEFIGPTLEDIRAEKLSIGESCQKLLVGEDEVTFNVSDHPQWYSKCHSLAQKALGQYLGRDITLSPAPCASFAHIQTRSGQDFYYEGLIARDSLDETFLHQLITQHGDQLCFYLSLPDEKDVQGICDWLDQAGAQAKHIILEGERGKLDYTFAQHKDVAYKGPYDDAPQLIDRLDLAPHKAVYFAGTQTYLRLIKKAYFS